MCHAEVAIGTAEKRSRAGCARVCKGVGVQELMWTWKGAQWDVQGVRRGACRHGQGAAGGAGDGDLQGSCAAQSSSSPNAPLQRAGPQIRAGLRGAGISQPLGALRGRERGRGRGWGLREGGGGGWYWCSCGPTWGQAGDKGEGIASTRGACCSGETEARSCFPQGRPQGSAAQLKQIGGGEA